MEKCHCKICKIIDKHRWATIMECGCVCHIDEGIAGHESLCCEYPNGKKKDNPYKNLRPAIEYRNQLLKIEEKENGKDT